MTYIHDIWEFHKTNQKTKILLAIGVVVLLVGRLGEEGWGMAEWEKEWWPPLLLPKQAELPPPLIPGSVAAAANPRQLLGRED